MAHTVTCVSCADIEIRDSYMYVLEYLTLVSDIQVMPEEPDRSIGHSVQTVDYVDHGVERKVWWQMKKQYFENSSFVFVI